MQHSVSRSPRPAHPLPGAAALALLLALLAACTPPTRAAAPVRVAAAADLGAAFTELGEQFEQATGQRVVFSFGSTGLLAKQIRGGAPFDVFAAANVDFVEELVRAGACDGSTQRPYARGRIALWSRRDGVSPARALEDLADPRFRRIAIASPEHAPYGMAAREALVSAGLWEALEPRLVHGENIRQALQFARSGNVEVAIVALALVVHDDDDPWTLIEEPLHRPIDQALVVCPGGKNRSGGEAFAAFVTAEPGRELMRRYGFALPDESAPGNR